jgi:hypothetical protein
MRGVKGTVGSGWSAKDLRDMATGRYVPSFVKTPSQKAKLRQGAMQTLEERGLSLKPKKRKSTGFGLMSLSGRRIRF